MKANKFAVLVGLFLMGSLSAMEAPSNLETLPFPTLLSALRNRNTPISTFRRESDNFAKFLAGGIMSKLPLKRSTIETPCGQTDGYEFAQDTVFVPVLRSGLTLLFPILPFFRRARVGMIGLARDEKTAVASQYYEKFPHLTGDEIVVVLDPMLATGGSSGQTIQKIKEKGVREENIIFAGVIAAPEGVEHLQTRFPDLRAIIVSVVDERLNERKFIVPGLGDYGDRYFGTDDYDDEDQEEG